MCPDRSILSAWFDGEVDIKWSSTIESHLATCSDCSNYIAKLKDQRELLHSLPMPDTKDSLERVKMRIREKQTISKTTRFWERRIPLPAAAAAAVLAAAMSLGTNVIAYNRNEKVQMANLSDVAINGTSINLPGDKVDEIFSLMESAISDEFSSNVIMELPSDVSLQFNGDSHMVRSAGFSGSTAP